MAQFLEQYPENEKDHIFKNISENHKKSHTSLIKDL